MRQKQLKKQRTKQKKLLFKIIRNTGHQRPLDVVSFKICLNKEQLVLFLSSKIKIYGHSCFFISFPFHYPFFYLTLAYLSLFSSLFLVFRLTFHLVFSVRIVLLSLLYHFTSFRFLQHLTTFYSFNLFLLSPLLYFHLLPFPLSLFPIFFILPPFSSHLISVSLFTCSSFFLQSFSFLQHLTSCSFNFFPLSL